jgi:hypothetical protein
MCVQATAACLLVKYLKGTATRTKTGESPVLGLVYIHKTLRPPLERKTQSSMSHMRCVLIGGGGVAAAVRRCGGSGPDAERPPLPLLMFK